MTGVGLSVCLLLLVGCSRTYDDGKPSASEQAAHDREGAGVLLSSVVINSTNDSFKRLIEQNSEEELLNACKNKDAEPITTSIFAPIFDEGLAIALKTEAAQSAQGTPGFPLTPTEVKAIALNQIQPIRDFYCENWLATQSVFVD